MSLNQKMYTAIAVGATGLILFLLGRGFAEAVGLVLLAGMVALNFAWLRCPYCGSWLGKHPGEYCKHCGGKIDWKKKSNKN